jgi:tRNA(Ile)-lysidine synthase
MAGAGRLSAAQRALLAHAEPFLPDAPLVIALSGGADSAVCGWVAARSRRAVRAVSIDHGLANSPALMQAAVAVADRLGMGHTVVPVRPAEGEAELRDLRYRALESAAEQGEYVATGHTADDQAETVLAHLLRGSGAAGVAGIPQRRGRWIRPLLNVRRSEVRIVAAELGLPTVEDPANEDRSALRNRIRHEVLPVLRDRVAPSVDEALVRAARHARADEDVLGARAAAVPLRVAGDEVHVPAAALQALPRAVAARVVRRALRIHLDPYPGSEQDVDNVLDVAAGAVAALPVAGGLLATRELPWVTLHPAGAPGSPDPAGLTIPGRVEFGRWIVTATRTRRPPVPVGRRQADLALATGETLLVRGARPGDRIDIGSGSQPVVEALRVAGVPARLRSGWPVVEAGGRMAWIAGARPAAWAVARGPGEATRLALGDRE